MLVVFGWNVLAGQVLPPLQDAGFSHAVVFALHTPLDRYPHAFDDPEQRSPAQVAWLNVQ